MRLNYLFSPRVVWSLCVCMLIVPGSAVGQTAQTPTSNPGFKVAPPKDEVMGKDTAAQKTPRSQVGSPDRTVGPQQDGSIVAPSEFGLVNHTIYVSTVTVCIQNKHD